MASSGSGAESAPYLENDVPALVIRRASESSHTSCLVLC